MIGQRIRAQARNRDRGREWNIERQISGTSSLFSVCRGSGLNRKEVS